MSEWFEISRVYRPDLPEDERGLTYKRALALVAPFVADQAEALEGDAALVALLADLDALGRRPSVPPGDAPGRRPSPAPRPPPADLVDSLTIATLAP